MWGVPDQHSDEQQETAEVNTISTFKIEVTKTLHSSRPAQDTDKNFHSFWLIFTNKASQTTHKYDFFRHLYLNQLKMRFRAEYNTKQFHYSGYVHISALSII